MENLIKARTKKGMTQDEVAEHLGVHRTTYNRYETGLRMPDLKTLSKLSVLFGVSTDYLLSETKKTDPLERLIKIPLLGSVPAGTPIEAIEDVEDYLDYYPRNVKYGELFALRVVGDSMDPEIRAGDIVVVEKQDFIDNGDIAIVRVNGDDEVTVKKVKKTTGGILLVPSNRTFEPQFFTNEQIATLPITIIGKVIESRRRF